MYVITLDTGTQNVSDSGSTARLVMKFSVNDTGSNATYSMSEKNIRVMQWNKNKWGYNIDELQMAPGQNTLLLGDADGYLKELFAGKVLGKKVDKRAFVEIYVNGNLRISGKIVEDSIHYSKNKQELQYSINTDTDIINKTMVYDDDGTILNPLGLTDNTYYRVTTIIEKIYQLVNPSVSLITNHTWIFWGLKKDSPAMDLSIANLKFEDLFQNSHELFFDNTRGFRNLGEVLKKLAIDYGCITGLFNYNTAFFIQLFAYNSANVQTLQKILSMDDITYNVNLIEYVKVTVPGVATPYTVGTFKGLEDKTLTRDTLPFCYSSGMSRSLLGTAGTNIFARTTRTDEFICYEFTGIGMALDDIWENNGSQFSTIAYEASKQIQIKRISGSNDPLSSNGTLTKISGSGTLSTINYSNCLVLNDVDWEVYRGKDINISNTWKVWGQLLADFWYHYRSNIDLCRIDVFGAKGLNYDFIKNFTDDGYKYQIIDLEESIKQNYSTIRALNLGEI